jgi:hypothetical protein
MKIILISTLLLFISNFANAGLITMAKNPSQSDYSWVNESVGNSFTVNQNIWVQSLGIWDENSDGLVNAYNVSLFDDNQLLLSGASVFSGTSSRLEDGSRWTYLSEAIMLTVGKTYTLATYRPNFSDLFQWVILGNVDISSEINLLSDQYVSGSNGGLAKFPSRGESRSGIFGVNMQYSTTDPTTSVPEPSTLIIFSLGVIALVSRRFKIK